MVISGEMERKTKKDAKLLTTDSTHSVLEINLLCISSKRVIGKSLAIVSVLSDPKERNWERKNGGRTEKMRQNIPLHCLFKIESKKTILFGRLKSSLPS